MFALADAAPAPADGSFAGERLHLIGADYTSLTFKRVAFMRSRWSLSLSKLPHDGYILYVGITGDTSGATLYSRYPQYVTNLKKEHRRPAVFFMLKNWSSDLFFNYVLLAGSTVDLGKMEKSLLSGVVPPVNKRDIEATITAAKAAA